MPRPGIRPAVEPDASRETPLHEPRRDSTIKPAISCARPRRHAGAFSNPWRKPQLRVVARCIRRKGRIVHRQGSAIETVPRSGTSPDGGVPQRNVPLRTAGKNTAPGRWSSARGCDIPDSLEAIFVLHRRLTRAGSTQLRGTESGRIRLQFPARREPPTLCRACEASRQDPRQGCPERRRQAPAPPAPAG